MVQPRQSKTRQDSENLHCPPMPPRVLAASSSDLSYGETIGVAENSIDRKKARDDLKIKRAKMFEQFLEHPMDTRLALAIKIIDDQIADCAEWIQTKDKSAATEKKNSDQVRRTPSKHP